MVAIVTSFLAPLGLRLTMPRVRMTDEEARRILASESTGAFDPRHVRVLLPRAGAQRGGRGAARFRAGRQERRGRKIVHVTASRSAGLAAPAPVPAQAGWQRERADRDLPQLRGWQAARDRAGSSGPSIAGALSDEARRGADIVVVGSGEGPSIGGPGGGAGGERRALPRGDHEGARSPRRRPTAGADPRRRQRGLAPGGGARRCATPRATGATLALAVMTERRPQAAAYAGASGTFVPAEVRATSEEELQRISVTFRASDGEAGHPAPRFRSAVERRCRRGRARRVRPRHAGGGEPRHPAPAVLWLRERAAHSGHRASRWWWWFPISGG